MSFRLHTHFCVNNSFSFSKSLRKQVRKSAEVWAEWRAPGSLRWDLAWQQEPPSPRRVRRALGVQETLSPYKGLPGHPHLRTMGRRSLSWTNTACDGSPEVWLFLSGVDSNHHLNAYNPKGHLFLKYAHLCVRQFLLPSPSGNYFLKIHEI